MTVKELIEDLQTCNPDAIVICSSDSEGNSFSPLSETGESGYKADSSSSGQVGLLELTPKLRKLGYSQEDVLRKGVPALVLYPIR